MGKIDAIKLSNLDRDKMWHKPSCPTFPKWIAFTCLFRYASEQGHRTGRQQFGDILGGIVVHFLTLAWTYKAIQTVARLCCLPKNIMSCRQDHHNKANMWLPDERMMKARICAETAHNMHLALHNSIWIISSIASMQLDPNPLEKNSGGYSIQSFLVCICIFAYCTFILYCIELHKLSTIKKSSVNSSETPFWCKPFLPDHVFWLLLEKMHPLPSTGASEKIFSQSTHLTRWAWSSLPGFSNPLETFHSAYLDQEAKHNSTHNAKSICFTHMLRR